MAIKQNKTSDDFSLVNFTDDELRALRDEALVKYDDIIDTWAVELKEINEKTDFDPYSRKGERIISKLGKKYADPLSDVEIVLETIQDELDKRDNYNEQQRYMEGGDYTRSELDDNEFLKREKEKTERIRKILED